MNEHQQGQSLHQQRLQEELQHDNEQIQGQEHFWNGVLLVQALYLLLLIHLGLWIARMVKDVQQTDWTKTAPSGHPQQTIEHP